MMKQTLSWPLEEGKPCFTGYQFISKFQICRDPDKPDRSSIKNVEVLEGLGMAVTFNDTEISKTDISGACLALLSSGNFLFSNGIDRGNDGTGEKETQAWFVQPDIGYELEKADKTK